MKQGTTTTLSFNFKLRASEVSDIIFRFKRNKNDKDELLKKELSKDEAYFEDGAVKLPLNQDDTLALTKVFWIEAQIIFSNRSTIKSTNKRYKMDDTLGTTSVENSQSDGNEETIDLDFDEYVVPPSDYEKIKNHPYIEDEEVVGHKTAHDYGLAKESDLNATNEEVAAVKRKANQNKSDIDLLDQKVDHTNEELANKVPKSRLVGRFDLSNDVSRLDFAAAVITAIVTDSGSNIQNLLNKLKDFFYDESEVNGLLNQLANSVNLSVDTSNYVVTLDLKHNNTVLATSSVDLPIEQLVMDVDYDSTNKEIVITLKNGNTTRVSVAGLVAGLVSTTALEEALADYDTSEEVNAKIAEKTNKVFDAVYHGETLSRATSDYPGIKKNDLIIDNNNNPMTSTKIWRIKFEPTSSLEFEPLSSIYIVHGTPPLEQYGSSGIFVVDQVVMSDNGNLYRCLTATRANDNKYTYTWQTYDIEGKQPIIDANHKVDADFIDDSNSDNKFVTEEDKAKWSAKQEQLNDSPTVHIDQDNNITATESKYELIKTINISQLSEQVSMIIISQDENGNPFGYDDILIDFANAKTDTDSKIAIDTYTDNDSNPITTFSRANSLNSNAKSIIYDIIRKGANMFESILGGFYSATKIERKRNAQIYNEKINKVEIYTDGLFIAGILKIYGRNKY